MRVNRYRCAFLAAVLLVFMFGVQLFLIRPTKLTPSKPDFTSIEPGAGNIFFIETSCIFNASNITVQRKLNARQACAIESAARMNPDRTVYLLDSCLSAESEVPDASIVETRHELSYSNVRDLPLDFPSFLAGTPLDSWLDNGKLSNSKWPVEHASDIARLVALWKYGGIYMDLDVVVLRSLDSLGSNFIGAPSKNLLANGVMGFTIGGFGHEILDSCLEELRLHYKGNMWIHNGPGLITRVLKRKCNVTKIADISPEGCRGMTVHPMEVFYKIPYPAWKRFFNPADKKVVDLLTNSSIAHMWNSMGHKKAVNVGSLQPYGVLASRYCPRVYSYCGETF